MRAQELLWPGVFREALKCARWQSKSFQVGHKNTYVGFVIDQSLKVFVKMARSPRGICVDSYQIYS